VKVGIYNEPREGGIGGSEISVAVLAEALASSDEVEIVHHKQYLTRERLAEISGTDLQAVRMRHVEAEPYSFGISHSPLRRYRQARDWQSALTEPYDLFINFTHGFPPFCHAEKGALVVLFPFDPRPCSNIHEQAAQDGFPFWRHIKSAYHGWEWRKRLDTYHIKATISQFSRRWTSERWGIQCDVIYPPADTTFKPGAKRNIILSVGRFTSTGHSKKQLEMVSAFAGLQDLDKWKYLSVGGLTNDIGDRRYFESVSRLAQGSRVIVLANVERKRLRPFYEQAKLFWHAAGYGDDQDRPELSEHFGLATVEAMSGGCVPIVVNRGGQPEIVEHGVSGFLWDTLDELKDYTRLLVRDERLRLQMANAARARAAAFSRNQFVSCFLDLLGRGRAGLR